MTGAFIQRLFLAAILLLTLLAPASAYDENKLKNAERSAILLQAQLRGVAARIDDGSLSDDALPAQRVTLEKIRTAANVGAQNVAGPLNEIAGQVDGLGPPPADGQQETDSIAAQRKDLNTQLARATAAQKQFVLVGLSAEQALARLTSLQRGQFLQRIFKADRSILNFSLWTSTFEGGSILWQRIGNLAAKGLSDAEGRTSSTGFLLLPLGLLALGFVFFRILPALLARLGIASNGAPDESITGLSKLWHALWGYFKYVVALVIFVAVIIGTLEGTGYLTPPIDNLFSMFTRAIQPALLYGGLIYFLTSPRRPEWRIVAVDNAAARSLVFLITVGYLVYGFGDQISAFASSINLPVSFAVGQTAASSFILIILIALGLLIVRQQSLKGLAGQGTPYFLTWFMNFMPLWWLLLGVATIALLFGFIALSYFIAGNLLDTAILAVAMGALHAFTDALASALSNPNSRPGHTFRRIVQWSEQSVSTLVLVMRTMADAILIIVSLVALVALWTVVLFDFGSFTTSLSEGFQVGNITLSPDSIAIAALVLAVGFTATKYFTQWLERRVLSETHLDKGVQDSLRAVAGYTGYSLAAAFALTAAGVNFSSLALVAGALGVGIGFGLQSIVQNFVSGLILLAERPVRVGDWVITNAGEGIIKKINVRSTEIETFDNCTIIVPNSNLISEAVRNWTHRDSIGRFYIPLTVTHTTDADAVAKQFMMLMQQHPKVMRHPAPTVQLARITTVGFEFDLRGHLQDIFEAAQVTSDLRLAIARMLPTGTFSSTLPPGKPPEDDPKTSDKLLEKTPGKAARK